MWMGGTLPPRVEARMLSAEFWLHLAHDPDDAVIQPARIAAFNAAVYDAVGLPRVLDLPPTVARGQVEAWIEQYQAPPDTHYGAGGRPLAPADWAAWLHNTQPELPGEVDVAFGLAVGRADVRALPVHAVATARPFEFAFDRLHETTVDVGWPVAALAASRDGQWRFCLTPHYWGWLKSEHLALATRDEVAAFVHASDVVTVVASRALVALPHGGVTPQMGTRLPLLDETDEAYRVSVPTRKGAGTLQLSPGWVARSEPACVRGTLPPTLRSVFEQAFRMLGEPYAWGGSRLGIFGRDCSRFVRDVYATIGVLLPRNAGQQAAAGRPVAEFPPGMSVTERAACLAREVPPGALLALPGHIMVYLGAVDQVPYAIHATSSGGYSSVIVSDLSLGEESSAGSLLSRLACAVAMVER